jgi:hypothetical protein
LNTLKIVHQVIDALNAAAIPYMLVGSFSSNFFGRPRSTKDADFVVVLAGDQLTQLVNALGNDFRLDTQMSFESITMTMRYIVHCMASPFTIELFQLSPEPHDQSRFARRQQVDFDGRPAFLPTAEDVVVIKLRWAAGGRRVKDVEDVRDVLAVRGPLLDLAYIRHWTDVHGTRAIFEKLWAESNPDAAGGPV